MALRSTARSHNIEEGGGRGGDGALLGFYDNGRVPHAIKLSRRRTCERGCHGPTPANGPRSRRTCERGCHGPTPANGPRRMTRRLLGPRKPGSVWSEGGATPTEPSACRMTGWKHVRSPRKSQEAIKVASYEVHWEIVASPSENRRKSLGGPRKSLGGSRSSLGWPRKSQEAQGSPRK